LTIRKASTIFLLLCATVQCVLSIFFVNRSYLDLSDYAAGIAPLPFQHRLLLIPFVKWAQSNHLIQAGAARFVKNLPQYESMTAAKFACMLLGVALLCALGLWTVKVSSRLQVRHWWLIWSLTLAILFASYAARFEQPLWYPYDIPHLVIFGAAVILILLDNPIGFLAALSVDAFIRETSIFLIFVAAVIQFRSRVWRLTLAAGSAVWLFSRWLAHHLYPNNPYQPNGLHWYVMAAPWHWPQVFSIVGFLWIPVWFGVRYLPSKLQLVLYASTTAMLFSFFFSTWNETRVWSEWTVVFAILASTELESKFSTRDPSACA
jgi:hypothetical protein